MRLTKPPIPYLHVNHSPGGCCICLFGVKSTAGIECHEPTARSSWSSSQLFPRPNTCDDGWHGLKSIFIANPIPVEKASLRRTESSQSPGCRVMAGCSPFFPCKHRSNETVNLAQPSCPPEPKPHSFVAYFFLSDWVCSLSTFLTIFCSSMRKARTTRSRTQLPHLEPPYARWTVFLGLESPAYSRGRRAGI